MDYIISAITTIFSTSFVTMAITKGISLLYGALGEMMTEKAGNMNLGIPGIMYMGAVGGIFGAYMYENNWSSSFSPFLAILIALAFCLLFSMLGGLIYSFLTITLKANQNVTGLALTTFGTGFANFLGGSLAKLSGNDGLAVVVRKTGRAFKTTLPFYEPMANSNSGFLKTVGEVLFSYGFLTYVCIALAIGLAFVFNKTRWGLNLRAVGENPAAADAAGVNVNAYKYIATMAGSAVAGIGGMYFVMERISGVWQNNALGDTGWLAVALVIFALWRPGRAIWGSLLFGGLCVLGTCMNVPDQTKEIVRMLPYIMTVLVLVVTSLRKRREDQPPQSLGLSYFREER